MQSLAPPASPLEESLLLDTTQAVAKVKEEASLICKDGADTCNNCLRRLVMGELRRRGYNAAICKARWDHAGGYPGGHSRFSSLPSILEASNQALLFVCWLVWLRIFVFQSSFGNKITQEQAAKKDRRSQQSNQQSN